MSLHTEGLSTDLLEQVLSKLGLAKCPEPTLAGLQTLYAAWCRKVPFDNVRRLIHLHSHTPSPLPGDTPADFFTAWLIYGTGGTCWAGNRALHALLIALGFDATCGISTILTRPDAPPNHGTVLVTCEDSCYVVDTAMLYSTPLPLDESAPTSVAHPAWGVHCRKQDGAWYIRWRPLLWPNGIECRLEQMQASHEACRKQYEQACGSRHSFNYALHARSICGESVVGVARGRRVVFDSAGGMSRTRLQGDDRLRILIDELGMHEEIVHRLPQDRPVPSLPRSRIAQAAALDNRGKGRLASITAAE